MSAYLMDPAAIGRLAVSAATLLPYHPDADMLAVLMGRENLRSVAYRYPDAAEPSDWCDAWGAEWQYLRLCLEATTGAEPYGPTEASDVARSLEYQSCEHPEWQSSAARGHLVALREACATAVATRPAPEPVRTPEPSPRYLTCAESAKLLRKALKAEFPGVKFSVRSETYAGGASINVGWLDGPTERQVDGVLYRFRGADFDGMIDLQTYRRHWLTPEGEIYLADVEGTLGSRGTIAPEHRIRPHDDAECVRLGSDYVSGHRNYSRAMLERAADWCAREWGARPEIREHSHGGACSLDTRGPEIGGGRYSAGELAYQELHQQPGPRHARHAK